jgi:hypothetical protein
MLQFLPLHAKQSLKDYLLLACSTIYKTYGDKLVDGTKKWPIPTPPNSDDEDEWCPGSDDVWFPTDERREILQAIDVASITNFNRKELLSTVAALGANTSDNNGTLLTNKKLKQVLGDKVTAHYKDKTVYGSRLPDTMLGIYLPLVKGRKRSRNKTQPGQKVDK